MKYFKKKIYLNTINNKIKMNNDFYNRVFLSNKVLNTTTVQPVIRPVKVEGGEVKNIIVEEKNNQLEEKNNQLEEKLQILEDRLKVLEEKVNGKNIVEFELNEFDKMIIKEEPNTTEES